MGNRSRKYEHRSSSGRHSSRHKSSHGRSRSEKKPSSSKQQTKRIDASSHFSDLKNDSDKLQKTPLCVVAWVICTALLTALGLTVLLYFSTDNLTHSASKRWVLDGSDLASVAGRELSIEYSNIFGSVFIKEHTQGGEYIEIWREDSGNKDYLDLVDPEIVLTDTTAVLKLSGPSLWEFAKAAARKSEYTIYVPNNFVNLKEIKIRSVNGISVIDLPTADTIDTLDLSAIFDLSNVIGASHIMNGRFNRIHSYTFKPHLCVGVGLGTPDYDKCFASVARDMRVTSGVRVNQLEHSSFNGNFFGHNMQLVSGTSQEDVNKSAWKATTLNGLVHFTWDQEAQSFRFGLPTVLNGTVQTSSWKIFNEDIVLFQGPDGLFDGYKVVGSHARVFPTTAYDEDTGCVKGCAVANHDSLDVDINGVTLPPLPNPLNTREIQLKALIGNTIVRNQQ